jgi:hypothetical protein
MMQRMYSSHITLVLEFLFLFPVFISCGNISSDPGLTTIFHWKEDPEITEANDQKLTEEQQNQYRRDAEILAVRYINTKDSTQTEIPNGLINLLYNGLVHIATSDLSEAYEVTKSYPIHARMPKPRDIIIYPDSSASWITAWRNGKTITGNKEIDALISQFNFTLNDYRELEALPECRATLESDHAINSYAVARLFENLDTIKKAGSDSFTDENDISVLFFDDHLQYRFVYGYGDCPAGCIYQHVWKFHVYRDGSVKFNGEEGPLPS